MLSITNNADTHEVRRLQESLVALGYSVGVDGRFGILTGRVLVAFQSGAKIAADGNCGPVTWEALSKALAPPPPPAKKAKVEKNETVAEEPAAAKPAAKKAAKGTMQ